MAESPAEVIRHRAAVIGSPVSHSLSPVLHRAAYAGLGLDDWTYERRETDSEALSALLAELAAPVQAGPAWAGLSVTMPHKQTLLARLDVIDPLAEAVGAVNTVVAQRSGAGSALLAGFNTDVAGIVGALRETARTQAPDCPGARLRIEQAVVLGSGATACSALAALGELRAGRITVVARRHAGPVAHSAPRTAWGWTLRLSPGSRPTPPPTPRRPGVWPQPTSSSRPCPHMRLTRWHTH